MFVCMCYVLCGGSGGGSSVCVCVCVPTYLPNTVPNETCSLGKHMLY